MVAYSNQQAWHLGLAVLSPHTDCGSHVSSLGLSFLVGKVEGELAFVGEVEGQLPITFLTINKSGTSALLSSPLQLTSIIARTAPEPKNPMLWQQSKYLNVVLSFLPLKNHNIK